MRARVGLATAAVLAAVLSVGGASAHADLDQNQGVIDEFECFQPDPALQCPQELAQTISVGISGQLIEVDLPLNKPDEGWHSGSVSVELREGSPSGAVLGTGTTSVFVPSLPTDPDYAWVGITFHTKPVNVTAGQVLAITAWVTGTSPGDVPVAGWGRALTDQYSGGMAWAGDGQGAWKPWADGSDLAFRAFVIRTPPTCDVAVAVGNGQPSDRPVIVQPGDVLTLMLDNFPPNAEATWALVPERGAVRVHTVTIDSYGDYWIQTVFQPDEAGEWQFAATVKELEGCEDSVRLTVLAQTTTPSPTPRASRESLPDTSAKPDRGDGLGLRLGLLLAGSIGAWLVLTRSLKNTSAPRDCGKTGGVR